MTLALVALLIVLMPIGYLVVLALAAVPTPHRPRLDSRPASTRFVIAIPAHDEQAVIAATIRQLCSANYPPELYAIHVVADNCTDDTAELARQAGAIVHERHDRVRAGKGEALSWLIQHTLNEPCDAVVIFDADTQVDPEFFNLMDQRLAQGAQIIQGQHIIRNSTSGWFPALTWAMFLIDNRFQNQGRANLGWSAKNMGDSICFRAEILRQLGWGDGLTEDYQLRQRLLLEGFRISYEPRAKGYGEAPRTWAQARAQRARWLRGTRQASEKLALRLFFAAFQRRDLALLDGALQAYLPSFSTLTLVCVFACVAQFLFARFAGNALPRALTFAWVGACLTLFFYPLFGLALERAPARAYLVILTGPLFIVWRTLLAITARRSRRPAVWVRTAHGEVK